MTDMQHSIRAVMLDKEPPPRQVQSGTSPVVAPVPARDWRTIALVAFGAVFLLILGFGVVQLASKPDRSVQPAPVPVATVMPLAIQYAKPDASGRVRVIRATVDAHPAITPGRPLIIMPNAPDYATRRQFSERCAVCHQPY